MLIYLCIRDNQFNVTINSSLCQKTIVFLKIFLLHHKYEAAYKYIEPTF